MATVFAPERKWKQVFHAAKEKKKRQIYQIGRSRANCGHAFSIRRIDRRLSHRAILRQLRPIRAGDPSSLVSVRSVSRSVVSQSRVAWPRERCACAWIYPRSRGCARLPLRPRLLPRRLPVVAAAVTVAAARRVRARARAPRETHDAERRAVSQPVHGHGQHRRHLALPAERESRPRFPPFSSFPLVLPTCPPRPFRLPVVSRRRLRPICFLSSILSRVRSPVTGELDDVS